MSLGANSLVETLYRGDYRSAELGKRVEAYRLIECLVVDILMLEILAHLALDVSNAKRQNLSLDVTLGVVLDNGLKSLLADVGADVYAVENRE